MTVELMKQITTPNLVCHFCGLAKPPYETVMRGHFRLCRECLLKHQLDIVAQGTREIDEPVDKE
jgi:primosomal protein N'